MSETQDAPDDREASTRRAADCRAKGAEAEAFAASTRFPEMRANYLKIAASWRLLADEAERLSEFKLR